MRYIGMLVVMLVFRFGGGGLGGESTSAFFAF